MSKTERVSSSTYFISEYNRNIITLDRLCSDTFNKKFNTLFTRKDRVFSLAVRILLIKSIFNFYIASSSYNSTIYLILPFYNFSYTFTAYPLDRRPLIWSYVLNLTERLCKMIAKGKYLAQNKIKTASWENECICF